MKPKTKRALQDGGLGLIGWGIGAAVTYALLSKKSSAPAATGPVNGTGEMGALAPMSFLPKIPTGTILGTIRRLVGDLGSEIGRAASRTNVPAWLITVIAAKEIQYFAYTRTNPAVQATGPGQMTPLTMFDVYYIAQTWGLVSTECDLYLKNAMGGYWSRFRQLAMNRQADSSAGVRLLKNTELNLTMAGLHLACLMRLFGGGATPANAARVVLGYNRGIAWSMRGLAKDMGTSETNVIKMVARSDWSWPQRFSLSPVQLAQTISSSEAKAYIADHLAPGGYFDQAQKLGLTSTTTL